MGGGVWGGVEKGEPNHKRVVIIQHTGRDRKILSESLTRGHNLRIRISVWEIC